MKISTLMKQPSISKDGERFRNWQRSASALDRHLFDTAMDLEEKHFADMRLQSKDACRRLFTFIDESGESFCDSPPPIGLHNWVFWSRVPPTSGVDGESIQGRFDPRIKTIWINPSIANDQRAWMASLMHEMIHAYEVQLPRVFAEWLIVDLCDRLRRKLKASRLKRLIDNSTHNIVKESGHAVLFLLKSIDIDLRLGWPLGSTFGYGREEVLQPVANRARRGATPKKSSK